MHSPLFSRLAIALLPGSVAAKSATSLLRGLGLIRKSCKGMRRRPSTMPWPTVFRVGANKLRTELRETSAILKLAHASFRPAPAVGMTEFSQESIAAPCARRAATLYTLNSSTLPDATLFFLLCPLNTLRHHASRRRRSLVPKASSIGTELTNRRTYGRCVGIRRHRNLRETAEDAA